MTLENHAKVSKQISAQGSSTYCAKYVPFYFFKPFSKGSAHLACVLNSIMMS